MFSQLGQWGLSIAAIASTGVDDAHQRAQQMHRHRDVLERVYRRVLDLDRLSRSDLEARARRAGMGEEYLDSQHLRTMVARVEVELELSALDARARALTTARDWPALEEALRRGWAPVLRYEGHAEHDAAVRELRQRIVAGGYRVLPEDPGQRFEEVPC